jgi:Flp pilus assembly protein TadD
MGAAAYPIPPGVDTEMVQGYRFAGLLRADQGKFAEAEHLLGESVRRSVAAGWRIDANVWYYLGHARLKLDRLADARECFENALKVDPDYPGARNNLAYALVGLGRLDEATREFETIVRRDPDNSTARANLARALAMLGRIDQAVTHFRRAIEVDPVRMQNLREVAELLRREGRADDAARLMREVSADSPDRDSAPAP